MCSTRRSSWAGSPTRSNSQQRVEALKQVPPLFEAIKHVKTEHGLTLDIATSVHRVPAKEGKVTIATGHGDSYKDLETPTTSIFQPTPSSTLLLLQFSQCTTRRPKMLDWAPECANSFPRNSCSCFGQKVVWSVCLHVRQGKHLCVTSACRRAGLKLLIISGHEDATTYTMSRTMRHKKLLAPTQSRWQKPRTSWQTNDTSQQSSSSTCTAACRSGVDHGNSSRFRFERLASNMWHSCLTVMLEFYLQNHGSHDS